jgi:hypothetical protein
LNEPEKALKYVDEALKLNKKEGIVYNRRSEEEKAYIKGLLLRIKGDSHLELPN